MDERLEVITRNLVEEFNVPIKYMVESHRDEVHGSLRVWLPCLRDPKIRVFLPTSAMDERLYQYTICVLAHELGHFISYRDDPSTHLSGQASFFLRMGSVTEQAYRNEVLAWENAEPIIVEILGKLPDFYHDYRYRCLSSYWAGVEYTVRRKLRLSDLAPRKGRV